MDYFIRQQFAPTASVTEADSTMSDSSMMSSDGDAAAVAPASTDMEMMTATDNRSGMKEEPTKKNRNQKKQKKNKGKKASKKNLEKKEDEESATE